MDFVSRNIFFHLFHHCHYPCYTFKICSKIHSSLNFVIASSFENFELRKTSISNTLDLRGYKVEDALDSLEFYLDKASLANLAAVTIIHGHGTGALKSAVRDFLTTSPYVAKWRVGEDTEGGDGVSIVDIK